MEKKADNNLLNDTERLEWLECRKKWLEKEKVKTCMMKQKSRIKWILEGDENTKFFHSIINRNNIKNNLRGLYINGIWQDSPDAIKTEAFNHFSRIFKELEVERPYMEELIYPCLSADEASALELPFSASEIKEAVFDCGGNKAPDPDGFNMKFYKNYWEKIKNELIEAIGWFWNKGEISKGSNSSFNTLISKKLDIFGLSV
ncbi:uncharacterized protein [Rutidosis leptorrhynchoides]|uniref:uncharacterized protein n=1 Tax=Rutidosis leptorrhynchoides TaxID=125765 RepID=UPI003A99D527